MDETTDSVLGNGTSSASDGGSASSVDYGTAPTSRHRFIPGEGWFDFASREWKLYRRTGGGAESRQGETQRVLRRNTRSVAPPAVNNSAEKNEPPPKRKSFKKADAAAAGAFCGGVAAAFSLVLTGNLALAKEIEPGEFADMGKDLAECLETLPVPITETINKVGPWGKLGIRVGNSILVRVKMVNDFNARKHLRTVPTTPQNGQTHTTQPQVVHTAQPQAVYNRVGQEVILPDPGAVGPPSFTFGDGEVTAPQPAEVYAPQPISAQ